MHFVGSGSEIEIEIEDKKGNKAQPIKGQVFGDYFAGSFIIPDTMKEEITFTAKLSKHGLQMKSKAMTVFPLIKVTNMKWGQKEAKREDVVKLSADIEGVQNDTEVMILIYEYDRDGAHDFITKFPCPVKNKKINAEWEYDYHADTDEIPTDEEKKKYGAKYNPPEYFFMVAVDGKKIGEKQESGLLTFKDRVEFTVFGPDGKPCANKKYTLTLADGTKKNGSLDSEGKAVVDDVAPGRYTIEVEDIKVLRRREGER